MNNHIEKKSWISVLRIFATLAVIWLHANSAILGNSDIFTFSAQDARLFAINFYLVKWAVPVFLMITGALLLDPARNIDYKKCLKYARRIFYALLLFGIPLAIIKILGNHQEISFESIFFAMYEDRNFAHLWYLYILIGIYLTFPLFRGFAITASKTDLKILLSVLFLFNFVLKISSQYGHTTAFSVPISWYVFYIFLGYYCETFGDNISKFCCPILVATILIFGIMAFNNPTVKNVWLDGDSPLIAFMAVSIFIIFSRIQFNESKTLWKIDRLCFGVYLIHPLFIQFIYRLLKITPMRFGQSAIGILLLFIIFTLCSFVFSFIASMIKPLKKYVM